MRASGHSARTRGALLSQRAFELQGENSDAVFWLQAGFRSLQMYHKRTGIGRLAHIGCSRPAALLNPMPFFRFGVLKSKPPTSELGGSEFFANVRAKNTDGIVSFISQLCGSDRPATSVWIEVVITPPRSGQEQPGPNGGQKMQSFKLMGGLQSDDV